MLPLQSDDRWRIPEFTQCSQCKQHETENSSVCFWMKQSNTSFKSVGSRFQAQGVATEKTLSPIFQLIVGIMDTLQKKKITILLLVSFINLPLSLVSVSQLKTLTESVNWERFRQQHDLQWDWMIIVRFRTTRGSLQVMCLLSYLRTYAVVFQSMVISMVIVKNFKNTFYVVR